MSDILALAARHCLFRCKSREIPPKYSATFDDRKSLTPQRHFHQEQSGLGLQRRRFMKKSVRFIVFVLAAVSFAGVVSAQRRSEASMRCPDYREDGRLYSHCEIKEQTVPAGG